MNSPDHLSHTAASRLVLSLFPGAGLLDRGFEVAGFCVVRGPDTLLGQSIETFRVPAGHFVGVIGGPPCQDFSRARRAPPTGHGLRMLTEFARCVTEAAPVWWLMENVPGVPTLKISGYTGQRFNLLAAEFGLRQRRNRSFQFGSRDGVPLVLSRTQSQFRFLAPTVLARDRRRTFADLCELQGLPRDFDLSGLSRTAKIRAVGNGVPVPMALAVAEAIRDRGVTDDRQCACRCGRLVTGRQQTATAACRKRLERARRGDTPETITFGTPLADMQRMATQPPPTLEHLAAEVWKLKITFAESYLCAKGVAARYNWSRSTLYRRRHDPAFPPPRAWPGHVWKLGDLERAEQAGHLPGPV